MLRLILIDDDRFTIDSLNELIPWQSFGFEIAASFTNTGSAVKYITENPVDCIITDINMPKPDGLDIIKLCAEKFPNIKIILLSAYRDFQYAQLAIHYNNVIEYVTKPIDYPVFKKALENLSHQSFVSYGFETNEKLTRKFQVFTDLIFSKVTDEDQIKQLLKSIEIDYEPGKTAISLLNFHISDFGTYIQNIWKHDTMRFYYALTYLVPAETADAYFALALYAFGNISWIVVHKNENYAKSIRFFTDSFIENGAQLLDFTAELNHYNTYPSITSLQKSSFLYADKSLADDTIAHAVEYIKEHCRENISLEEVAAQVFMSSSYFSTSFKQKTGKKFIDFLTTIRMDNAAELLINNPDISISEVCASVGYNHLGHFYKTFKKHFGVTPNEYRTKYQR